MIFVFLAVAAYLLATKKPTSVTDYRLGRLGSPCGVCGFEASEPWHRGGDCWYEAP